MKFYTNEQIKRLKDADVIKHFDTVIDSQFKRGTTSAQDNLVADIYDEATGGKTSRSFACKSCVYNLYLKAGQLYRDSVKKIKADNLQKARDAKKEKQNNKVEKENNNE